MGAAPNTWAAIAESASVATVRESPWSRYHVTKPWMPAWTIIPTQERSSADRSVNQALSDSIRVIAAVLRVPTSRSSWSEASSRSAEGVDTLRG